MKAYVKIILATMLMELTIGVVGLSISGCAAHQPVVTPVPNQTSALDGQVFRGLSDVQAVIDTYKSKVADGTFVPNAAISKAITDLVLAYNDTRSLWEVYHAATAATQTETAASLQSTYNTMETKYTAALASGAPAAAPVAATTGAK